MTAAYEELIQLLDNRDVSYSVNDDQSVKTDIRGEIADYRMTATVDSEDGLFQVFGYVPHRVPEGARQIVGEAVLRANYGLRVGKFELDLRDGEIRFQASQIMVDDAVGQEVIDRLIITTLSMLDMYLPAFLSVIYGNEQPEDAIRRVETWSQEDTDSDQPENTSD